MGAAKPAEHLLRRLDADVARAVRGRDCRVVAFSGGLASLVLVALIRKRCDVVCEVLGLPGSADVEAAVVAEKFLDYPVRVIRPTPAQVLLGARTLAGREAALSTPEVLSLVPLFLLAARHPREPIVSGFGLTWESPRVRSFLPQQRAAFPGLRPRERAPPPRVRLLGVADLLGLPEAFSRASRRRPAEGSAVGPAVRAAAHVEHVTLDRFLRARAPVRENHKRA